MLASQALCNQGHRGRRYWLENHAIIEDEDGLLTTIKEAGGLRMAQLMLNSLRWHQREIWKCPDRKIIGKARQIGFSTDEELNLYFDVKKNSWNAAVIADDLDSAKYLFEKFERCHANDDLDKPALRTSSVRQMRFEDRQGRVEVSTAQSPDALRSRTLQAIHGSECAFWGEDGPKCHKAIMKFVRDRLNTSVTYESTGNGEDPLFYSMWQNASKYCKLTFIHDKDAPFEFRIKRKILDEEKWNGFHPLFVSVLIDERARHKLKKGEEQQILATLDEEEKWLVNDIKVSLEFLKWRRWAIVKLCDNDINDFHEQYPVTENQMFVKRGSLRFNIDILNRMIIEEGRRGFLRLEDKWSRNITFVEEPHSDLTVFRNPDENHRHILAIDPAEGIESEGRCEFCSGTADETSIQLYDMDAGGKLEQIALFHGPYTEEEVLEQFLLMAEWAHGAFVVIERVGGHGEHITVEVEKRYPAERIFSMEGRNNTGLKVHAVNRPDLIADVASLLHNDLLAIHSERTVHQLSQVKKFHARRYQAASGHHDDDLSSLWGIVAGWRNYPRDLLPLEASRRMLHKSQDHIRRFNEEQIVNPDPMGFY